MFPTVISSYLHNDTVDSRARCSVMTASTTPFEWYLTHVGTCIIKYSIEFRANKSFPISKSRLSPWRLGQFLGKFLHWNGVAEPFPTVSRTSWYVDASTFHFFELASNSVSTITSQRRDWFLRGFLHREAVVKTFRMIPRPSWYVRFRNFLFFDFTSKFLPTYLHDEATNRYADFCIRKRLPRLFCWVQERLGTSSFGFSISMASPHQYTSDYSTTDRSNSVRIDVLESGSQELSSES